MRTEPGDTQHAGSLQRRAVHCAIVLSLFLLSILIVACGESSSANTNALGDPAVTVTITMGGQHAGTPTPSLPKYWCGAWATNTSPTYNATTVVGINARFTQNVNGNPVGVGDATATATVMWTSGNTESYTAKTTPDGLAVFSISTNDKAYAVNKVTLVTVSFNKSGITPCLVGAERAAFFTLIVVSPTKDKDKNKGKDNNNNGGKQGGGKKHNNKQGN